MHASICARGTGTIVQITSMGGITTAPGYGAYCAAKHALEAVSESLAAEVAPLGIRVLVVEPGSFRTGELGLKVFGTMGLRDHAGTPKSFYATWAAARATR